MADAGRWKPYGQRQGQMLPALVDDARDPGNPVFFIDDVVEGLDLTALEQRHATLGEHAYDPRLLRPFAEIEQAMRFRRCQPSGRANVWGEWNLVAAACNLRRLFALGVAPA